MAELKEIKTDVDCDEEFGYREFVPLKRIINAIDIAVKSGATHVEFWGGGSEYESDIGATFYNIRIETEQEAEQRESIERANEERRLKTHKQRQYDEYLRLKKQFENE